MLKQSGDTILLVEDEESEILLARQAVASCPGEPSLVVVRDSTEALAWVSDASAGGSRVPCLILLNLKLPKLLGLAVLRTLRMDERTRDVPIVVFSAVHEHAEVLLSYQIGANCFVNMPTNLTEFTALLAELSELGWLGNDTHPRPSQAVKT